MTSAIPWTCSGWCNPRRWARSMEDRLIRWSVPVVVPRVRRVLPHDPSSFTQGLVVHDDLLYESSGGYGTSSLRAIDLANGRIVRQVAVPDVFAEGIAIAGQRLFQLSWKDERVGVFEIPALRLVERIPYRGEGWGLCRAPGGFWMSNGTSRLQWRDERFSLVKWLPVRSWGLPVRKLNDLTWADGRLLANVWGMAELWEICPRSGRALRIWDCQHLLGAAPGTAEGVFNGVAYDPQRASVWVTGKHWRSLFELAWE